MQASLGFGESLQQSLGSVHKLNVDECWQDGLLRSGLLFLATLDADQAQGVKVIISPSIWVSVPQLHSLVMKVGLVQCLLILLHQFSASSTTLYMVAACHLCNWCVLFHTAETAIAFMCVHACLCCLEVGVPQCPEDLHHCRLCLCVHHP